ncbi:hypothetical protein PIB30_058313 [Stylosanthes scabra]|uniref:Putative plant transposon protein domain-containing protein n=1 Tax=Stylosanthes scabra TaxID=79078 RepID=A0ABU6TJR1_9FABA|nr:hypothetical protein [Stylosanthes scabra]
MLRIRGSGVVRTKFVGERPVSQRARTRAAAQEAARAAAERELAPFSDVIYDSHKHYERSKLMRTKKVLNERIIQIPGEGRDFMIQMIHQLEWDYMYNDLVDINVTIVKELYSNFSKSAQRTVYLRGTQINIDEDSISSFLGIQDPIPRTQDTYEINKVRRATGDLNMNDILTTIATPGMTWDRYNPKSRRVDNGILKREARGWMKMMVCNLKPLRHKTTYSWDTIMLLFTLMDGGSIHLGRIINKSMYDAAIGKRDQRLAFPVLITRLATAYNVPTYPEENIMIVEEKDKYCPFGDWQQEKRKARKGDLPRTSPPPIPPPIHETQDHPSTSAAAANQPPAAQTAAQPPVVDASCTHIFKKILRRLRRRKQDQRNTQYMIRTAFPEEEFPDIRTISTSDSDNANYS